MNKEVIEIMESYNQLPHNAQEAFCKIFKSREFIEAIAVPLSKEEKKKYIQIAVEREDYVMLAIILYV